MDSARDDTAPDPLTDGTVPADADLDFPSDGMHGARGAAGDTDEDPSDAGAPDGDADEGGLDDDYRAHTEAGALSPGTTATSSPTDPTGR